MVEQQMELCHTYVDEHGVVTPILSYEELQAFDQIYESSLASLTDRLERLRVPLGRTKACTGPSFLGRFAQYAAGKQFQNPDRELSWALHRWSPGTHLNEATRQRILREVATIT